MMSNMTMMLNPALYQKNSLQQLNYQNDVTPPAQSLPFSVSILSRLYWRRFVHRDLTQQDNQHLRIAD